MIRELNKYLRGWVGNFGIQEFNYLFRDLDAWIRSRLRSTQLKKCTRSGKFQRIMIGAGFDPKEACRVWIKMDQWQSVMRRPVRLVLNLEWFRARGSVFMHDLASAVSPARWARLLIEERYTRPVRTVLQGGDSLRATSYQIMTHEGGHRTNPQL